MPARAKGRGAVTEAELDALIGEYADMGTMLRCGPILAAEVRRLRGLIQQVEWKNHYDIRTDEYDTCPWCFGERVHKPICPAFPPEKT
jgi:hypothetical protein